MDTSLDKFYKFVCENQGQRIPEAILGKITVAVSGHCVASSLATRIGQLLRYYVEARIASMVLEFVKCFLIAWCLLLILNRMGFNKKNDI